MRKNKKLSIIVILIILSTIISIGCSNKEEDFDASGYVKASLDATFHGEYAEYARDLAFKNSKGRFFLCFQEKPAFHMKY